MTATKLPTVRNTYATSGNRTPRRLTEERGKCHVRWVRRLFQDLLISPTKNNDTIQCRNSPSFLRYLSIWISSEYWCSFCTLGSQLGSFWNMRNMCSEYRATSSLWTKFYSCFQCVLQRFMHVITSIGTFEQSMVCFIDGYGKETTCQVNLMLRNRQ